MPHEENKWGLSIIHNCLPSAAAAAAGGTLVPYMLDEDKNWGLSMDSLKAAVKQARSEGKAVRGLVFINPGGCSAQIACSAHAIVSGFELHDAARFSGPGCDVGMLKVAAESVP
jgi:hypothetical protein